MSTTLSRTVEKHLIFRIYGRNILLKRLPTMSILATACTFVCKYSKITWTPTKYCRMTIFRLYVTFKRFFFLNALT